MLRCPRPGPWLPRRRCNRWDGGLDMDGRMGQAGRGGRRPGRAGPPRLAAPAAAAAAVARGRAAPGGLALAALAMLLGAAAWWWLAVERPRAGASVMAGATAPAAGTGSGVAGTAASAQGHAGRQAALDGAAAAPGSGPLTPAAPATATEPTGDLQVPAPVPLQRGARHRPGATPNELPPPAAAVDLGGGAVAFGDDASGRTGRARLGHGAVTEAELGLRAPPGAVPRPEDSSRVQDASGSMLTATSFSGAPLGQLAAFYRAQFAAGGGAAQEMAAAAGQWSISAGDGVAGERSVLLIQEGAQVRITVSRWQPAAAPPAMPAVRSGARP